MLAQEVRTPLSHLPTTYRQAHTTVRSGPVTADINGGR